VSIRRRVVSALTGLGLVAGAVIALASSIVLHGAVLLLLLVAGLLAAGVAYGIGDGGRARSAQAAWKAAAGTVLVIVLVTGVVVLAGGVAATLATGLAGVAAVLRRRKNLRARQAGQAPLMNPADRATVPTAAWQGRWQAPVSALPTSVLGREWLQTTSELASPVTAAVRQETIRRRQEVLDELERRDPAGFARWLTAGTATRSDPATFVRDGRTTGSDAV
jgi:hypothetical protein